MPLAATLGVALLARSLVSYAVHVAMHKVPVLWRVHRVHHTDVFLDVSTTVRFHPLEFLIQLGPTALVILGLGLPPWTIMLYELVDTATNLFIHANARVPARLDAWLRLLLVTPDMHRVHHSALWPETDSNYGVVVPWWDRLFGTYRTATAIPGRPGSGSRSARTGGPRLSAGSSRSRSGRAWSGCRSAPDMTVPRTRSGRASSSGSSAHPTVPTGRASGDGSERPGQD